MSIIKLDNDNFFDEILETPGIALVDFWASWCGPCKGLIPVLESVAEELEGKIQIFKANIDEADHYAALYKVRTVPTLILFQDGEFQSMKTGVLTKTALISWIEEFTENTLP